MKQVRHKTEDLNPQHLCYQYGDYSYLQLTNPVTHNQGSCNLVIYTSHSRLLQVTLSIVLQLSFPSAIFCCILCSFNKMDVNIVV